MIPEAAARLSRRSVVAAAVAAVGTGCSTSEDPAARQADPGGAGARPPGAAEQEQAVRDSTRLLGQYDDTAAAYPSLAARLRPLRAEVARHVTAFGGTAPAAPRAGATKASGAGTSGAGAVPGTPAKALAALAGAERALADRRATALLRVPGGLALLLASVAAAGAGHVALLGTGGSGGTDGGADSGAAGNES